VRLRSCSFESEIGRALKDGHWPEGCTPELREHVTSCSSCGDLVLVTQTFQKAKAESVNSAPVGAPGLIWWRAQLRRRSEVTTRVTRPITVAQTFAVLLNVIVATVLLAWQYNHGLQWSTWWAEITPSRSLHMLAASPAAFDWNLMVLVPGIAAVALLGGIVVYLASEKS
jgi:hypothetical protein